MTRATSYEAMGLVLLASFIGSFGAVFLKSGAARLRLSVRALLSNWHLMLGVGLFLLSSVAYLQGIKGGELSVLYPMVSLGYIWTLFWSKLFFGEPLTRMKFLGLFLIIAGVCFVGAGS
jgi:drug/metabolite transporter (DMT)-like permease